MNLYQAYADQGVVVWAIATPGEGSESEAAVRDFAEALGITMPVLLDDGGLVHAQWPIPGGADAPYPQEWIVGTDGDIAWFDREFDLDEAIAVIEAELAESDTEP